MRKIITGFFVGGIGGVGVWKWGLDEHEKVIIEANRRSIGNSIRATKVLV